MTGARFILQLLVIGMLAPIAACAAASLVLYGGVELASFIPLMIALPCSLLLLSTAFAGFAEPNTGFARAYAVLLLIGLLYPVLLGVVSGGEREAIAILTFYGVTTAVFWIAFHALSVAVAKRA
jgi:hypothetical protein